jgi:hypothetical protein
LEETAMPFANDCLDTIGVPPNRLRFVSVGQCTCTTQALELHDPRSGDVIDLTQYGIPGTSSSPSSSPSSSSGLSENFCGQPSTDENGNPKHGIEIVVKELPSAVYKQVEKLIPASDLSEEDAANGIIRIPVSPTDSRDAGVFVAMAIVWENGVQRKHYPFYFEVTPNLDNFNPSGPLNFFEVRQAMRDLDASSNFLIDRLEVRDEELMWAMQRPIDYWNEAPPPVGLHSYKSFPYRYHWLEATVGELLRMLAVWLRRNDLDYSAAGLSVADTRKWPEYARMAQERMDTYKVWVQQKKIEINVSGAFGSIGGYRHTPYR